MFSCDDRERRKEENGGWGVNLASGSHFFLFLIYFFNFWLHWVFVAARGLFSGCGERGLLFVAVHSLLIAVASLVEEHGF